MEFATTLSRPTLNDRSFKTIQLGSFGDELTEKKKRKETSRFIYDISVTIVPQDG